MMLFQYVEAMNMLPPTEEMLINLCGPSVIPELIGSCPCEKCLENPWECDGACAYDEWEKHNYILRIVEEFAEKKERFEKLGIDITMLTGTYEI